MSAYSTDIYKRICTALAKCSEFKSDSDLRTAFADPRISHWQDLLPSAINTQSRVRAAVDFLQKNQNRHQENALVLLLRVLSESYHPDNALHHELLDLAFDLQKALAISESTTETSSVETANSAQSVSATSPNTALTFTMNAEGFELRAQWALLLVLVCFLLAILATFLLVVLAYNTGNFTEGAFLIYVPRVIANIVHFSF